MPFCSSLLASSSRAYVSTRGAMQSRSLASSAFGGGSSTSRSPEGRHGGNRVVDSGRWEQGPQRARYAARPQRSPQQDLKHAGTRTTDSQDQVRSSSRRLAKDLVSSPPRSRRPPSSDTNTPSSPIATKTSPNSTAPLPTLPLFSKTSSTPITRYPFAEYSMNPRLKEGVSHFFGADATTPLPTPIQALSLQHFVGSAKQPLNRKPGAETERHEVLLGSETGSGKTLAYLLPLLHNLKKTATPIAEDQHPILPRSIVLVPTHELARQITQTAKQLSHQIKLRVRGFSSTESGNVEHGVVDVLVATLGRFARAVDRGYVSPERLEWVVVDEADVLLGPDFQEQTSSLLGSFQPQTGPKPSLILSTATIPPSLMSHINREDMNVHRLLSPSLHKLPTKLKTRFVPWSNSGNKLADVVHEAKRVIAADAADRAVLAQNGDVAGSEQKAKILIFCNSPGRVKMLEDTMNRKNVPCVAWTGGADERVRGSSGALNLFLRKPGQTDGQLAAAASDTGKISSGPTPRVLITTSLLSRGLDFTPSVKHVFLIDEPRDMLDFLHRAGRTGRAGRVGNVVVFGDAARDRFSKMMSKSKR